MVSESSNGPLQMCNPQPAAAPSGNEQMFLHKKGLFGGRGPVSSIVSPTDNVLSPCSAKLSGAKQRHFQKGKPVGLASQLSQLAASGSGLSIASNGEKPKIDF